MRARLQFIVPSTGLPCPQGKVDGLRLKTNRQLVVTGYKVYFLMGVRKSARDQLGRWVSYLACVDRPVPALILAAPEQSLSIRPHLSFHPGSSGIGWSKATDKGGVLLT